MKIFKVILLLSMAIFGITLNSCKKKDNQKRDFYLEQSRDENLVGVYHLFDKDTSSESITVWEIKLNGEIYSYSIRNDNKYGGTTPKYYWYSKNGKMYLLFYSKSWDKGSYEEVADYWFSDTKDTLYTRPDYVNTVSIFVRQ